MKNALIFFYNIYITEIEKLNNNYYFSYQNNNYIVALFDRNINEISDIYQLNLEMMNYKIPVYKIILTKENNILMLFEEKYYILMQFPNLHNRLVTFEDVLMFNVVVNNNYKNIDKSKWNISWPNKIDYIENQFYQLQNKYPIIRESINYYIGIWENGISYYNNNLYIQNDVKVICHKRVTITSDLLEFYNPLNIIIDYKERDLVDYLKSYIYENNWTKENLFSYLNKISNINITRFISRAMFPSNYFDLYEDIIIDKRREKELNIIIAKKDVYEKFLKYIFEYYSNFNIPIVEWLIKKD